MTLLSLIFAGASGHNVSIVVLILVLLGVVLFLVGFRTFRQYRLIEDTPQIPIRSVAMGLVHVQGKSTGGTPLKSPLTGVPCYYYQVTVEKRVQENDREEWKTTSTQNEGAPFYLEDATGRILVNPQRAEFDVVRTFTGEVCPPALFTIGSSPRKFDETLGVAPPTDEHLRAYLSGQVGSARAALQAAGMPVSGAMAKTLAVADKMQQLGVSIGAGGISMDFGSGHYRLTETCLVAGRACNVLGTCAENPNPADESDRNLIRKGENEKSFLITTRTEKQIERSLRWRAVVMIVIGAALILGGVAVGLNSCGML